MIKLENVSKYYYSSTNVTCALRKINLELKIGEYIDFHPATKDIIDKYQSCDIFCLPSNYEGFPNVICEAMSCKKPIVCSRVCDNQFLVQENVNGILFDNLSIEDMANKLQIIIQKPQNELLEWGVRSRKIAETLFSKHVFIEKYVGLIEE